MNYNNSHQQSSINHEHDVNDKIHSMYNHSYRQNQSESVIFVRKYFFYMTKKVPVGTFIDYSRVSIAIISLYIIIVYNPNYMIQREVIIIRTNLLWYQRIHLLS